MPGSVVEEVEAVEVGGRVQRLRRRCPRASPTARRRPSLAAGAARRRVAETRRRRRRRRDVSAAVDVGEAPGPSWVDLQGVEQPASSTARASQPRTRTRPRRPLGSPARRGRRGRRRPACSARGRGVGRARRTPRRTSRCRPARRRWPRTPSASASGRRRPVRRRRDAADLEEVLGEAGPGGVDGRGARGWRGTRPGRPARRGLGARTQRLERRGPAVRGRRRRLGAPAPADRGRRAVSSMSGNSLEPGERLPAVGDVASRRAASVRRCASSTQPSSRRAPPARRPPRSPGSSPAASASSSVKRSTYHDPPAGSLTRPGRTPSAARLRVAGEAPAERRRRRGDDSVSRGSTVTASAPPTPAAKHATVRAQQVHPRVVAGQHRRRGHRVQQRCGRRRRRHRHLGDPCPQPPGGAELGDGGELVGGRREAELEQGRGVVADRARVGERPEVGDAGGAAQRELLRVGSPPPSCQTVPSTTVAADIVAAYSAARPLSEPRRAARARRPARSELRRSRPARRWAHTLAPSAHSVEQRGAGGGPSRHPRRADRRDVEADAFEHAVEHAPVSGSALRSRASRRSSPARGRRGTASLVAAEVSGHVVAGARPTPLVGRPTPE